MKKISFIIGCGWLGQPLAKRLIQKDFHVYGSTRFNEKIISLNEQGIIGFKINFENESVLLDIPSEVIQHAHSLIFTIPPTGFVDYGNSLLTIVKLFSEETNVIFASSTGVYKEINGTVNEESECNIDHPVFKAEKLLQAHLGNRLTILRLAGLIGENRHPVRYFLNKPNIPNGLAPVNLIPLEDVLNAFIQAVTYTLKERVYTICSPEHPTRMEYYSQIAAQKFGVELSFLPEGNGKIVDGAKFVKDSDFQYTTSIFDLD